MKLKTIFACFILCLSNGLLAQTSQYVNLHHHLKINSWVSDIFENPTPPKSYTYNFDYELPYVENLRNGFMDTFTIADIKFRYRLSPHTSKNCIVEKFDKGVWKQNLETEYSSYQDSFLCDVNNDGYKDFIEKTKWSSDALLFNPGTKEFDGNTFFNLDEWTILDIAKNIFCNSRNVHGQETSCLYTFKGVTRKVLYSIRFIPPEGDNSIIRKMFLYKGDVEDKHCNCVLIQTTEIHNKENEFDFVSYWKKRYKKLLGYH